MPALPTAAATIRTVYVDPPDLNLLRYGILTPTLDIGMMARLIQSTRKDVDRR